MGYAEQEAQTPRLLAEIERLKKIIKANEPKRPMTVEEMEKRWPKLPPFQCNSIDLWRVAENGFEPYGPTIKMEFEVTQDTIGELRDYLDAIEECMNG